MRNILTQQSPPTPSLRGVGGGLIAENIQMVEACPPFPPPSILSSPALCLGRRLGIDISQKHWGPQKIMGRPGRGLREEDGVGGAFDIVIARVSVTRTGMCQAQSGLLLWGTRGDGVRTELG